MSSDSELEFPSLHFHKGGGRGIFSPKGASVASRASNRQSRGQGRGRGRRVLQKSTNRGSPRPLGGLIDTIYLDALSPTRDLSRISNCEYVASYNWLNRDTPTILIPGMPPVWSPPNRTNRLPEDSGDYFRDPNAARYPKFPTEPAVRALLAMQPDFKTKSIDVVACGSTLGNLLRFSRSIEKDFRFDVELIGNTLFLIRKENTPTELIPDVHGYGHTFPEAYTAWDSCVKGSVSHQRIVKYSFGELSCLVRFESDGYLKDLADPAEKALLRSAPLTEDLGDDDKLTSLMGAAETVRIGEGIPVSTNVRLETQPEGRRICQNAVFDLKTRSAKREIDMEEVLPRLWVSQTSHFVIGYHKSGLFDDIRKKEVRCEIDDWEARNADSLGRLKALIQQMRTIAKSSSSNKLEVVRSGVESLEIREQIEGGDGALPVDLVAEWTSS